MTLACQVITHYCITALWGNIQKGNSAMLVGLFQITKSARKEWRTMGVHGSPELPGAARLAFRPRMPSRWGSSKSLGLWAGLLSATCHSPQLPSFWVRFRNTPLCSWNSAQLHSAPTHTRRKHQPGEDSVACTVHLPSRLSWQKPKNGLRLCGLFYLQLLLLNTFLQFLQNFRLGKESNDWSWKWLLVVLGLSLLKSW